MSDTPIIDSHAGWVVTQNGIAKSTSLMPDEEGPFVHSEKARELERDLNDQCRLLGMSGEREARLLARVAELERENARLRELGQKMCDELGNLAWLSGHFLPNEAEKAVNAWTLHLFNAAQGDVTSP